MRLPARGGFLGRADPRGGLTLHAPALAATVRYGAATWVDAARVRTPISVRWEGDAIALEVPAELLARSTYPAVLDPLLSVELPIQPAEVGDAANEQVGVDVATDGTGWLAVWHDDRSDDTDVYAARITAAGTVLDPTSLPVCDLPGVQDDPAVAFDGTNYQVVWRDERGGWQLYGARVSPGGVVLDVGGRALAPLSFNSQPEVASSGGAVLVVWNGDAVGGGRDLFGLRVSGTGAPVGSPFTVSAAAGDEREAKVVSNGSGYLALWEDHRGATSDIRAARIDSAGTVLDPTGMLLVGTAADERRPHAVWDGTQYLVTWQVGLDGVLVQRFSATLAPLDANPLTLCAGTNCANPRVAFDGTNFWVSWRLNPGGTNAVRVSPTTVRLDASPMTFDTNLDDEPIVISPSAASLLFVNYSHSFWIGGGGIHGWRATGAFTALDSAPIIVSRGGTGEGVAQVASIGSNFLVHWGEGFFGNRRVNPVTLDGQPRSAAGTLVDTVGNNGLTDPALASDGTRYLLVYIFAASPPTSVVGAFIAPDGTVLGPVFPIASMVDVKQSMAMTYGAGRYFIAYISGVPLEVTSSQVFADGGVTAPITYAPGALPNQHVSVAFDGAQFRVVWEDIRGASKDVYGLRIALDGGALDPGNGVLLAGTARDEGSPVVAAANGEAVVLWEQHNGADLDLYGSLWSTSSPAATPVITGAGDQRAAALTFDGRDYFAAWEDTRAQVRPDLYGTYLRPGPAAVTPGGFAISADPAWGEFAPGLGSDGAGRVLVAYERFDPSPSVRGTRVWTRLITDSDGGMGGAGGGAAGAGGGAPRQAAAAPEAWAPGA
ncbi:MAG: hypothetical protein IPJ65_23320 [Archangiaceae bacterium]|nr:hypothetical protein [Archangiaceae bacterium]